MTFLAVACGLAGLLLGGLGAALVFRSRAAAAGAAAAAEGAARAERLRSAEAHAANLAADLEAARSEAGALRADLRSETADRAKAEEAANRVPDLEVRLAEREKSLAAAGARESELAARMEAERKAAREREALLADLQKQLQDTFKALSADALANNNKNFLALATQNFSKMAQANKGDLALRQKSIEGLVKPINDSLAQVDVRIKDLEKQRVDAYAGLRKQVELLMGEQGELRRATGKLVTALRRPTVRGRWGEIQLRRVVELAGMLNHCDFEEQKSVTTDEGRLRPDMVVHLPGGRNVVVDSKAPLEAYLDAQEAPDEKVRRERMQAHARAIREHMAKLGQKAYWEHLQPTPEFVVMFLPGEIFFSAALEEDPDLIAQGAQQRVIVASPTTLIALLYAVAYGWRQETAAENAQRISELGQELHRRIAKLVEHFSRVGKGLGTAVDAYNAAASSLESRVLVQARRFKDLGAASEKELPEELKPLDKTPRELPPDAE